MAIKPASDESKLSQHTRGVPVGIVRPATLEEDLAAETVFRPDCVLALSSTLPADLSAFEQHVAALIDGVRPVARIRKKSGVSSTDLRIALSALHDRKLLRVAGIVEEAVGELARDLKEAAMEEAEATTPRGHADVIPAHVMREIQSMLDEDAEEFEDGETDVMSVPKDDTDVG